MINLKVDYELLAVEVSHILGRKVKKDYIKNIMTPSSKPCSLDIKKAMIKALTKHIENDFDLYDEVTKLFKVLK